MKHNNNAIINNVVEDSKTLFCSSKFPWAHERISSKFIECLGTRPQNGSPALIYREVKGERVRLGISPPPLCTL